MKVQEIGAFEAKTRLSELLDKVQRGQVFRITKRGKPIAWLSAEEPHAKAAREKKTDGLGVVSAHTKGRAKTFGARFE